MWQLNYISQMTSFRCHHVVKLGENKRFIMFPPDKPDPYTLVAPRRGPPQCWSIDYKLDVVVSSISSRKREYNPIAKSKTDVFMISWTSVHDFLNGFCFRASNITRYQLQIFKKKTGNLGCRKQLISLTLYVNSVSGMNDLIRRYTFWKDTLVVAGKEEHIF